MSRASSSNYDDTASNATPDYASTRKSSDTQESVERPRAGVLKTVGDAAAPQPAQRTDDPGYAVPDINFGRTVIPARTQSPTRAPTPGGLTPYNNEPRAISPGLGGRKSPGPTTGYTHLREESGDTARQVAWQPGVARVGSPSGERALTPEQFVQQRATSASATPLYAHGHNRSVSGNTLAALRAGTPTPPLRRNGSQELLTTLGGSAPHTRNNSTDLLQRPRSQNSGAVLSGGEMPSHLSAREQEHVARATGTPLIMGGRSNGPQPQAGLVGAIEAREREKQQMMHGLAGQAVGQAIDQRQREQHNQAQRAAQAAYQNQMAGQSQQNFSRQGAMSPGPGGAPSAYAGSMMGPMGMGGGPGPTMSPSLRNNSFGPGVPPQQRPQQQQSYGQPSPQMYGQSSPQMYGQPSPQMYGQPSPQMYSQQPGGAWAGPPPQQRGPPPQGVPPMVGMGMRGGSRPQSPAMQPPQRQFSPVGVPPQQGGPRSNTPGGGAPSQGQAF